MFTNVTGNKAFSANKKEESQECSFDQEGQRVDNAREEKKKCSREFCRPIKAIINRKH